MNLKTLWDMEHFLILNTWGPFYQRTYDKGGCMSKFQNYFNCCFLKLTLSCDIFKIVFSRRFQRDVTWQDSMEYPEIKIILKIWLTTTYVVGPMIKRTPASFLIWNKSVKRHKRVQYYVMQSLVWFQTLCAQTAVLHVGRV